MIASGFPTRMLIRNATALKGCGWTLDLIVPSNIRNPELWTHMQQYALGSDEQLKEAMEATKAELLYIQEAAWWAAQYASKAQPNKRIVTEVNDTHLGLHAQAHGYDEWLVKWDQHGLVFASEEIGKLFTEVYDTDSLWTWLHPHVPEKYYAKSDTQTHRYDGLFYSGDMDARRKPFRNWRSVAKELHAQGITFYCQPGPIDSKEGYETVQFVQVSSFSPSMMSEISQYRWGLSGFPENTGYLGLHAQNKFFDYIAAGLPIICLNAEVMGKLVEEWGIGVSLNRVEDIKEIYHDSDKYRKRLLEVRHEFVMEKHIHKLDEFLMKFL